MRLLTLPDIAGSDCDKRLSCLVLGHFWLVGNKVASAGPGSIGSGARLSGIESCTMPLPPGSV
jgi:hypothetical protein